MIVRDEDRIKWRHSAKSVDDDINTMMKAQYGEITMEEACLRIKDVFGNHPTPRQLADNMRSLGYDTRYVRCEKD